MWIYLLVDRIQKTLVTTFVNFVAVLETQYGVKVKFLRYDNDVALQTNWDNWVWDTERSDEPTAIYTQTQNGSGERSGEVISRQATAMRMATRFLEELWSEIWPAAVYLYNRIPCKTTGWKSPLEIHNIWLRNHNGDISLLNDLPTLVHLSIYGCRGYIFNEA